MPCQGGYPILRPAQDPQISTDIPPSHANAKDVAPFESFSASLQSLLHGLIPQYQPTYMIYRQPGFCFDDNLIKLHPPLFLREGYFQSEKCFLSCAQTIRDAFQLKNPLKRRGPDPWGAIKAAPWTVALHVRRGDYLEDPAIKGVYSLCARDYYQRAVNIINQSSNGKATYFIFSDDIAEARSMLSFISDAIFVTAYEDEPWVDVALMAACRDAIIANSSFSWWGAWLNLRSDKRVIAPRPWFQSKARLDTPDLIPSQWTVLDL